MATFGGPWTEQKLNILREYLKSYTTVMKNQGFHIIYVDAFAGEGYWRPNSGYSSDDYEEFGDFLQGSAAISLEIDDRPFDRFLFIEKNTERTEALQNFKQLYQDQGRSINIANEDTNIVLPEFCSAMGPLDRAVVFLDPFATEVSWDTVAAVARTGKIDCWILFPLAAIARMMPRQNEPNEQLSAHLDRVFGGREFWQDFYRPSAQQLLPLFGDDTLLERTGGSALIAERYKERLQTVFHSVAPNSKTLRNSKGSPLFEFYFAASNPVGAPTAVRIASHLLQYW